jgi:hypothetical protein
MNVNIQWYVVGCELLLCLPARWPRSNSLSEGVKYGKRLLTFTKVR